MSGGLMSCGLKSGGLMSGGHLRKDVRHCIMVNRLLGCGAEYALTR